MAARNYAVVSRAGVTDYSYMVVSWHATGNDAITARDKYDAARKDPRFTSTVLSSGQVEQLQNKGIIR